MRTILFVLVLLIAAAARAAEPGMDDYLRELDAALSLPPAAPEPFRPAPEPLRPAPAAPVARFQDIRVRVTSRRHTVLSSQSAGRVESLAVRDGDRFAAGDVLARIDDSTLQLQRLRAQTALARQEVLYRLTRELADLQSKGEAEVEVARMEMEQAQTELRIVDLLLARTSVAAPFPGRVADVLVREKQYVPEGAPLLEILDDNALELEFIVPSVWVRWFAPGYRFSIAVEETGVDHEAELERLGGKVDPLSQSMKAYARLLDPGDGLMEGMSGSARITPPENAP